MIWMRLLSAVNLIWSTEVMAFTYAIVSTSWGAIICAPDQGTGTLAFSNLTAGTVASQALLVGAGSTLGPTAGGILTANALTGTLTTLTGTSTLTDLTGTCVLTSGAATTARIEADPTDDYYVGGFLLVAKTTRTGRRS